MFPINDNSEVSFIYIGKLFPFIGRDWDRVFVSLDVLELTVDQSGLELEEKFADFLNTSLYLFKGHYNRNGIVGFLSFVDFFWLCAC